MKRYKKFLKAKLRSFILIIVDKLIGLLGLSRRVYRSCPYVKDHQIEKYNFTTLKSVRLSEIYMDSDKNSYPEVKTNDQLRNFRKEYPWDELEKSIRKHGIITPPYVTLNSHTFKGANKCCDSRRFTYKLKDGNHRCLIWSYIHEYKNPYIKVYVLIPFWEARIVDVLNPWDYPNLLSIIFNTKDDLTLKQKNKNIEEGFKKRKKELKSKTYGPDTDR